MRSERVGGWSRLLEGSALALPFLSRPWVIMRILHIVMAMIMMMVMMMLIMKVIKR